MAVSSFCPTCRRTVYVEEDDTLVCPVCSSPLVEAIAEIDDDAPALVEEVERDAG